MYSLLRPLLFALDPEQAHKVSLQSLDLAQRLHLTGLVQPPTLPHPVDLMGLRFANPIGLAAGLDKNGDHIDALGALGFGFIEVGTVTPRPQPGNPPPRLFRLPEAGNGAGAIINRMGFNNKGVDHLVRQVRERQWPGVLGINIGKNKDTPLERAVDDYLIGLRKVYAHADYVTVNISSPNTPGLRDLQQAQSLAALLGPLKAQQQRLADLSGRYVPLLVKIAPDLDPAAIGAIAATLVELAIDGVIATNTTNARDGVEQLRHGDEAGGLSGAPLTTRALGVTEQLHQALLREGGGELPIIGSGGIMNAQQGRERLQAGAELLQLYTGFIYHGPGLLHQLLDSLGATPEDRSKETA